MELDYFGHAVGAPGRMMSSAEAGLMIPPSERYAQELVRATRVFDDQTPRDPQAVLRQLPPNAANDALVRAGLPAADRYIHAFCEMLSGRDSNPGHEYEGVLLAPGMALARRIGDRFGIYIALDGRWHRAGIVPSGDPIIARLRPALTVRGSSPRQRALRAQREEMLAEIVRRRQEAEVEADYAERT